MPAQCTCRAAMGAATGLVVLASSSSALAQREIPEPSPAFDAETLASLPTDAWVTNGGNLFNQRYTPLSEINRSNVAELRAVWRASLQGSGMTPRGSNQAEPLYYDGTIYIVTSAPRYYDGLVITGTSGGVMGTRGRVTA